MEQDDENEIKVDNNNIELAVNNERNTGSKPEEIEPKKKKKCQFPTAYTILILIECLFFLLTYIIPNGLFQKIEYSSEREIFIITLQNGTKIEKNGTEAVLKELNIKIPLNSFKYGYINTAISIPNTYERIDGVDKDFVNLFLYPIIGLKEAVDISVFLYILGGNINILIETNSIEAGMKALGRRTKGKEFLLVIIIFFIMSICGSVLGSYEEFIPFYKILMPIFLKSGFDGMISFAPLYLSSMIGNMFSTLNPFSVLIASYSAGVSIVNGIGFRIMAYVIGNIICLLYIFIYYKKTKLDKKYSIVYDIRKDIENKFLIRNENENTENKINDEEKLLQDREDNALLSNEKDKENNKIIEFTWRRKLLIIIFITGFASMIFGVLSFQWQFTQMTALFIVFSVLLIIFSGKSEQNAMEIFMKGAGDFIGVSIIIGMARAINTTLEQEKVSDTILNSLTNVVKELPKPVFAIIMLLVFIFMGMFINSSSGLAVLSMPVFAPLADQADCSRTVIINAFMFGQYLSAIITPASLILIILDMVGIPYFYWIKFIWPFLIILFILLVILIMINVFIDF